MDPDVAMTMRYAAVALDSEDGSVFTQVLGSARCPWT